MIRHTLFLLCCFNDFSAKFKPPTPRSSQVQATYPSVSVALLVTTVQLHRAWAFIRGLHRPTCCSNHHALCKAVVTWTTCLKSLKVRLHWYVNYMTFMGFLLPPNYYVATYCDNRVLTSKTLEVSLFLRLQMFFRKKNRTSILTETTWQTLKTLLQRFWAYLLGLTAVPLCAILSVL